MPFLTACRAGLKMLLGLDGLGLLEDVHAAGEALEGLAHPLGLDDLGLLEDVHAAGETLKGLAHLLGLDERLHHLLLLRDGRFLEDVLTPIEAIERLRPLLLRRTQDRGKIFRDTDLRRSGGQGASTFVVTRSFAK